ncbi:MAG TPA: hypothetical protein VGG83_05175 [Trebonia sp.]|jgi:hypothetical protein
MPAGIGCLCLRQRPTSQVQWKHERDGRIPAAGRADHRAPGDLAISVRSVPRFTKDLDFAVAVADDSEAEDVVLRLRERGYQPVEILEQDYVERLSGVRLERGGSDVIVDLLFASSGIENEVVASATRLQVLPRLSAPVATTGHLIALKILAGRNQDLTDLGALIPTASAGDLDTAREAVRLISAGLRLNKIGRISRIYLVRRISSRRIT